MKLEKSILISMIFLVLIVSIGAISAADDVLANETLTADEIALDDNLKESPTNTLSEVENKTFTDLDTDIAGKTVADLESNYTYSNGDSAYANGITIDRELTINGNGKTTLNPNGNLLFNVGENGKLTLNDLTIVNTYSSTDAMITNAGELTLNNVTFTVERIFDKTTASLKYKTIENTGTMTVNRSLFKDSSISFNLPGTTKPNTLYYYGLIYNNGENANLLIENTTFNNNMMASTATYQFGTTPRISEILENYKGKVQLNKVNVTNNYVKFTPTSNYFRFIKNDNGELIINESIFENNKADLSTNSYVEGLINSASNTINISNSVFRNNTVVNGVIMTTDKNIIIEQNLFDDNTITYNDRVIYVNVNPTTSKINSNIFVNTNKYAIYVNVNNAILDIDYNYWGTNNPNFKTLFNKNTPTNYVNLTFPAEEVTIGEGKTFDITFKVNDEIITTLPDYTVTVNSEKLGSTDVEIKYGVGQYQYDPTTNGEDTITINGDEYSVIANFPPGSFTDLSTLISENGEITLDRNYTYQSSDSEYASGIPINKEIVINGNGFTLNANGKLLFNIGSQGNVTLNDVAIINSYSSTDAMIKNGGTLTLDNVTFTIERIFDKADTGLEYSTIENTGTMTVKNSIFKDSRVSLETTSEPALLNYYGLIYNNGETANLIIENTLIDNNEFSFSTTNALGESARISEILENNKGKVQLNKVNVTNNYVKLEPANTYFQFIKNDAGEFIINECLFENNKDDIGENSYVQGLINSESNAINVTDSLFKNNTVLNGIIITTDENIDIEKNIFNDNTVRCNPTVINVKGSPTTAKINNNLFINTHDQAIITTSPEVNMNNNYWGTNTPDFTQLISGTAPANYAIIKIEGETDLIPESVVEYTVNFKTSATNEICDLPEYTVQLNAANRLSDNIITISRGTSAVTYTASVDEMTDIINASVDGNIKANLEVTIKEDENDNSFKRLNRLIIKATDEVNLTKDYTFDAIIDSGLDSITIDKTMTINGYGHKINSTALAKLFSVTSTGDLTLKDVVLVTDYVATGTYSNARQEASIKNLGITTLNNVTFTLNQNVTTSNAALAAGIYNEKTLNIINSKFVDSTINTNTNYCFGLIDNKKGTVNIENTLFDKNKINDTSGSNVNGLIYTTSTLTLTNVNMTNNFVRGSSGLIKGYTGNIITIDKGRFENNAIESGSGTVIYIKLNSGDTANKMTITNSRFINNTGANNGGAICSDVPITCMNSIFEKNNALGLGGAIYVSSSDSNSIYVNNTFNSNNAAQGGALYSSTSLQSGKSYLFSDNKFINNYASQYGGAVYSGAVGTTTNPIENNVFINNQALDIGGAIYSTGGIRVTKALFQNNSANDGVAIYSGSTSTSTSTSAKSLITNTIFDNNVIKSQTGGLFYIKTYNMLSIENNYWETNTPALSDLIRFNSGTFNAPTDIAIIMIEGNETLSGSDVYIVSFKGNASDAILEDLQNYTVDISSTLNTVTPTSVVISEGEATFTYNAEESGLDTIKVCRNNVEITSLTVNVDIPKETPEFTIVANNVTYGEPLNLTFTVINGPVGENIYKWTISSKFGLLLESGNVTQDNKIISINSYSAGNYKITVSLSDNEDWNDLEVNDSFEIKQIATEIKPTVIVHDNDTVEIQVNITSDYENNIGGEISCEIDIPYTKEVEDGKATIVTNKLSPNKYTITLNYSGDVNYLGNATEIEFIINKTVTDEAFNITKAEDNKTYTFGIRLPSDAKGNLTVKIGEETESKALEDGRANITITMPCGLHEVELTYTGDENYKQATNISTIYIPGEKMPEDAKNATMEVPEGTTAPEFTINLPKNATGEFTVYVDGTPYTEKLVNGSATVKVPELPVGDHTISTAYSGDNNYEGFETANRTVTIPKASIPGGDSILNPTTPEGSDSPTYSISLLGATGNLTVTVDGTPYTKALENGSATVTVPKLAPGKHTITVAYSGDGKFSNISKTTTYTVKSPVIKITKNKDITMLYTAKTPYKVLVTVDGKAVVGEYVTFKFNGKTYKIKTDKNGYATLKLPNAKPKKAKYTVTAEYKGVKVSNKVKVNSVIKAKNTKVKKSKKVNKIKVTLKKVNGKFLKGKKLTLKIKGKKITAKTNKKGVAIFKIKKNILKKLKAGKKYKYTVTFGKNTVTKKLTVKK